MSEQANPPGDVSVQGALSATRERRQQLGAQIVLALHALGRNARSHAEDDAVFAPTIEALSTALFSLLETDGRFELEIVGEIFRLNGQALLFDASAVPLVGQVRAELRGRGIQGLKSLLMPPLADLRLLTRTFAAPGAQKTGPRGLPDRPFAVLTFQMLGSETDPDADRSALLVTAYAHAVGFVDHTIQQLRVAGEPVPLWAASRVVQDLVDLQRAMPRRFLQLARTKVEAEEYWGFHAANVAVLAISFAARLDLAKRRRHDLGMAALFHDVGMAAIPAGVLAREGALDARAQSAVKASPLFAARAILRDRDVSPAALERALAAYECHLDLIPGEGEPLPEIGLAGRILNICESYDALTTPRPFRPARSHQEALRVMTTEEVFRYDPELIDLLPKVVEPLL